MFCIPKFVFVDKKLPAGKHLVRVQHFSVPVVPVSSDVPGNNVNWLRPPRVITQCPAIRTQFNLIITPQQRVAVAHDTDLNHVRELPLICISPPSNL